MTQEEVQVGLRLPLRCSWRRMGDSWDQDEKQQTSKLPGLESRNRGTMDPCAAKIPRFAVAWAVEDLSFTAITSSIR